MNILHVFLATIFRKAPEFNIPNINYLAIKDMDECNFVIRMIMDCRTLDALMNLELLLDRSVHEESPYYYILAFEVIAKKQEFKALANKRLTSKK